MRHHGAFEDKWLTMDATGRRLHDNLFALPIEAHWRL